MTDTVKKELPGACCLAAGGVVYAFFAVRCGASLLSLVSFTGMFAQSYAPPSE